MLDARAARSVVGLSQFLEGRKRVEPHGIQAVVDLAILASSGTACIRYEVIRVTIGCGGVFIYSGRHRLVRLDLRSGTLDSLPPLIRPQRSLLLACAHRFVLVGGPRLHAKLAGLVHLSDFGWLRVVQVAGTDLAAKRNAVIFSVLGSILFLVRLVGLAIPHFVSCVLLEIATSTLPFFFSLYRSLLLLL